MTSPIGSAPQYPSAPGYHAPAAAAPQVDFATAVRTVLTQYATFSGRARRSEFWWFVLAWAIAYIVVAVVDQVVFGALILTLLFIAATIVPYLAVSVRRLHDTGRSGWWLLLNFVPFGGVVTLVFYLDSDAAPNQHGPSPKYQAA